MVMAGAITGDMVIIMDGVAATTTVGGIIAIGDHRKVVADPGGGFSIEGLLTNALISGAKRAIWADVKVRGRAARQFSDKDQDMRECDDRATLGYAVTSHVLK